MHETKTQVPPAFDPWKKWWTERPFRTWCMYTLLIVISVAVVLYLIGMLFPVSDVARAAAYATTVGNSISFVTTYTYPQWTLSKRMIFRTLVSGAAAFFFIKALSLIH